MEDHRFIPEFDSPRRPAAPISTAPHAHSATHAPPQIDRDAPRRFRKGDAVAEIRERHGWNVMEWSLVLNGSVVTTRQFSEGDRAAYDRELHAVTADLAGSGWREDLEHLSLARRSLGAFGTSVA